ncbi:mediator complex subunit [Yamadazyma tenuis]|uniref:Mediator of RNA polymerase II transcription subunit 5 n=1 Tax=Candida tenuis (strain ATCC 10573 / BCRC 21748 / CBS 615 / JCM 9827 / NBRC 10315 / NRRL Y-1498 / VKM Y-70) TaxID=590646 RepID=G3B0D1_CANTC|nr:Med5-domain-containing protein [Yamadazyma tenuis ATCC 10573]EGV65369.1 Med5-domain-containing protein [Yamadazyma tenuis ATCC 10573]WEJ94965.1 mediator complex subunit [Yamadazyma tenuis]
MRPIERLLHLSNRRNVSDKQFLHLFKQLDGKTPVTAGEFVDLLEDSSNERYLTVVSLIKLNSFWKAVAKLPTNQQVRILRKYHLKIHLITDVEAFLPIFVEYSEHVLDQNNEELLNELIFNWGTLISKFSLKDKEVVKVFVTKLMSFLNANNYTKQFEYCSNKFTTSKQNLTIQPRLNNLNLNVNSKNHSSYESIKIFFYFNEMFKSYQVPDNEKLFKNFNEVFKGDCYKLIYSMFNGIYLSEQAKQPSFVKNNWLNFLSSRVPKLILLYKVDNLEDTINKAFENFDNFDKINTNLKQYFIKSLIFNKILSIKSFHRFFPNEGKVNQQTLIHEMSNVNSSENFQDNLNDKLYSINCEFISIDESNLMEYLDTTINKVEFSMQKQVDLISTMKNMMDLLVDEQSLEKLNRLLLILLKSPKLFQVFMFNLSDREIIFKLIKLLDNDSFKLNDNNEGSFQEFFSYFGVLLLFIMQCSEYINMDFNMKNSFTSTYLHNYNLNYTNLTPVFNEEVENDKTIASNYNSLINDWINSLFDEAEGLSDDLIKSIDVKQVYQLIPLIYQQAVIAFINGKINLKILNNGLDYLSQNFLLPCSVSIVKWILSKISLKNKNLNNYLTVLKEIMKIISKVKDESSNELKLTAEVVLNFIIQLAVSELRYLNIPGNLINNDMLTEQIRLSEAPAKVNSLCFEVFETNLIKALNGNEADFELINYYVYSSDSMIKDLLITLNTSNTSIKTNNENLKLVIDFVIFINLNRTIKSEPVKQFWINKFSSLKIDTSKYDFNTTFEKNIDYHFSTIFNVDGNDDGNEDLEEGNADELFEPISFDYCLNEMAKASNDLTEFLYIVQRFQDLSENKSFLSSINLIHTKLLNDLKSFQC